MFRRKRVVQNDIVARRMRKFFRTLKGEHRPEPEMVARIYVKHLLNSDALRLVDDGPGQWILDAEPLLKAGLVWYLPSYSISPYEEQYSGTLKPICKGYGSS